MLAASPGSSWANAEIGNATRASQAKMYFIMSWTRGLRICSKEKLFRHRPMGRDEPLVTPDQRGHIAVTHPLRDVGRQHGAIPAAAVHDDFCRWFGNRYFQVAFENAFAKVNCLRGVAGQPFAVLTHVGQH